MIEELDEGLVHQAKRAPRRDGLTESERIALNLFWRKDVRVPILAQVFQCSKNTVYYSCLTGGAVLPEGQEQGRGGQPADRPPRRGTGVERIRHAGHGAGGQRRQQGLRQTPGRLAMTEPTRVLRLLPA